MSYYSKTLNYDEAFELTGHGRFNHIVLVSCCFIFMYCSLEMAGMSYVISPAECDLRLTVGQKSMVSAGIFLGTVSSTICWGSLSDRIGRRKIMLPALLFTALTSFLSSICTAFWALFPLRVLTGMLVAASTSTVLVYLGELHTLKHRDFALSIAITSDQVNFVILPGIAYLIIHGTWSFQMGPILVRPWRVFMWTWCLFALIGASILYTLPESPRFILASEGVFHTLPVLADIYAINNKATPSDFPIDNLRSTSSILHSSDSGIKNILLDMSQLLRPPMRRCYLITHYCMFMVALLANGLTIWMPPFINNALKDLGQKCSICDIIHQNYINSDEVEVTNGLTIWMPPFINNALKDLGQKCSICDIIHQNYINSDEVEMFQGVHTNANENCHGFFNPLMYPISMGMELTYLIPYTIVVFLIDKVNLRRLYIYIVCICSSGLFVSCLVPQIIVAMVSLTIGVCTGSMVSILAALVVNAFPTSLRALAMCTMYTMGQMGAITGVSMISLMHGFFCQVIFFIVILALLASAIVLLKCWPDLDKVREEMELREFTY